MSWGESVPFVTRLGMAVRHHELGCHGENLYLLQPNLAWKCVTMNWDLMGRIWWGGGGGGFCRMEGVTEGGSVVWRV